MKTGWKITLILIAIVLVIIFVGYNQKPKITGEIIVNNESSSEINDTSDTINEEAYIPDTEYKCEDLIPISLFLKDRAEKAPQPLAAITVLNKNTHLSWWNSVYNTEIGEKTSEFKVKGNYIKTNRIAEDGTILEDYIVYFDFFFDKNECVRSSLKDTSGLDCKILNSSCYWEYCENKGC